MNNGEYRYQLTVRPASSFTTPDGPGRRFTDENTPFYENRDHGTVYYSEPLSLADITHYSLIPVTEAMALNGKQFGYLAGRAGAIVTYTLAVDENGFIMAYGRLGEPGTDNYAEHDEAKRFVDVAELAQSGEWLPMHHVDKWSHTLTRDTPGIFDVWAEDIDMLRAGQDMYHIGACEPEEFAYMNLPDLATLGRLVVAMYDADLQIQQGTREILCFDLRSYLKPGL